jgi:hypothetical protein
MRVVRAVGSLLTAVALGLVVAAPMLARDRDRHRERSEYKRDYERENGNGHRHGNKHRKKKNHKIPELDPGVAGGAAVLLVGGTLALAGRRRQGTEA